MQNKKDAYNTSTATFWTNGFQLPLPGKGSEFGTERRVRYKDKNGKLVRDKHGKIIEDWKTHGGVDIPAPLGTPVPTPLDGKVVLTRTGYYYDGNIVILNHGDGLFTSYLHLDRIDVKEGDIIKHGTILGTVGSNGYGVTGPHLHWAAKYKGRLIDPHSLDVLK
jgi:murein DD-endopeptidase MepM/ murein hydrolase activator NlpD